MHPIRHQLLATGLLIVVAACGSDLPQGTESFTVGHTLVRTDSVLDVVGVVYRLADTASIPPRGAVRHWLQALSLDLDNPAIQAARAPGLMPVSLVLETYVQPARADTACGWIAPGVQRCFTGNDAVRRQVRDFLSAAPAFRPRTIGLEGLSADERRRDLADVYVALSKGKSLDSAVMAYSGFRDLQFDVTLARTLTTGNTTATLDPARPYGPSPRIFLTPDHVYNSRSYRSPNYIWLALSHQMVHEVVRRIFAEHPELLRHGFALRDAVAPEMNRLGYTGLFWDESFGEQLARAITIRILALSSPSITWAARSDALTAGTTLVPWLEDALMRYEQARERYPDLGAFVGELARAMDSIPTDPCQASESPGLALIGVARHRAVVGWMADSSPFRARRLLLGDTILTIDGDSASAAGLLTPTRQVNLAWARHLPFELGILDIRRNNHDYTVQAPIRYVPRRQVRIASQQRVVASDTLPICRWVTRARRR